MKSDLRIFGLGDSKQYAELVCEHIGERLSKSEETYFDDGECYVRSEENVRGTDVFVICSLYNSDKERLADKVVKLLYFTASLHSASARRITLVLPYMAYQRQDRKNKSRAPIYTNYFPRIIKSVMYEGDRILAMDPHNLSGFQSGIPLEVPNDHLEAKSLICDHLDKLVEIKGIKKQDVVVMSPDEGGIKRARFYRDKLGSLFGVMPDLVYVDKTHGNDGLIEAHKIIGNVDGKVVIVFDDMISSGKTMVEAFNAVNKAGGSLFAVCATHFLGVGRAEEYVEQLLEGNVRVITTDTVRPLCVGQPVLNKVDVLSTVPLIAEGIRCIHNEESISRLLR